MKRLKIINSIRHGRYLDKNSLSIVIGNAVGVVEEYDYEYSDLVLMNYYTKELSNVMDKYFDWFWIEYLIWDNNHTQIVGLIISGDFELK